MTNLSTESLTLSYGKEAIIEDLDLLLPQKKITVLIGRNGCGKSTLLRSMARLLKPVGGTVLLGGKEINSLSTKEDAKKLAILPQSPIAPEGLTVFQLVKQGRYPHQNWLQQWSEEDEYMVNKALELTKMSSLANRAVDSLSGGQRQRAWIAMTLAQGTKTILLDEPTTYLDLAHQIEVLDLLYDLNQKEESTIAMVLHDLNLACRYADNIVAIKDRNIYSQGKPEKVVNGKMVREVFGMECKIISDPILGTPFCIPAGKGRQVLRKAK
ncbi:MAG: ABC transporter ATP-binding protein [Halothermotrichaceae bacterium]